MLKSNITANFLGKASIMFCSLIFTPFYIHFLGMENYGMIGFYNLLLLFVNFLDLGLGLNLNKEIAKGEKNATFFSFCKMIEYIYLIIVFAFFLLFFLCVKPLSLYWFQSTLSSHQMAKNLYFIGIAVVFLGPFSLYSNGLLGLNKQFVYNAVLIFFTLLRSIGAFFILSKYSRLDAFFLWQICINGMQMLCMRFFYYHYLNIPKGIRLFNFSLLKQKRKEIFVGGARAGSDFFLVQFDKVILSKFLSLTAYGYYSLAWLLASQLYNFIHPIFMAIYPKFSKLIKEKQWIQLKDLYHTSTQMMVLILFPIAVIGFVYSEPLIFFWTKNAVIAHHVAPLFSILIIGTALNGISHITASVQLTSHLFSLPFKLNIINLCMYASFGYFLFQFFGVKGFAILWILMNMVYVFLGGFILLRQMLKKEMKKWFLFDLGLPSVLIFSIVLMSNALFLPKPSFLILFSYLLLIWLVISALILVLFKDLRNSLKVRQVRAIE